MESYNRPVSDDENENDVPSSILGTKNLWVFTVLFKL